MAVLALDLDPQARVGTVPLLRAFAEPLRCAAHAQRCDHTGDAQDDQREWKQTPPVFPEGGKSVATFKRGSQDTKHEEHHT